MIILGIDPGSYNCGYGIIQVEKNKVIAAGCGIIKISTSLPLAERLVKIYKDINTIIEENKPDIAAVETIFYGKNIKSAFTLGHARGAILLALAEKGIDIVDFTPREVKKAVVGNGNASKEQVEYMVQKILNIKLNHESKDASDALAVALCQFNKKKFRM